MPNRREAEAARIARVAEMKAAQARKERRSRVLIVGGTSTVVIALIAVAAVVIGGEAARQSDVAEAAEQAIPGVEETADLSAGHVPALPEPTPIGGSALPPLGGDHDPVPQNCGIYTEPVATANAVHSLEHGAVWITYHPDLAATDVATLAGLVSDEPYALLSPFPDLASPVVLTAWGTQLELDDVSDSRAEVFLAKYLQGEQTPEPGAPCSGGVGQPA